MFYHLLYSPVFLKFILLSIICYVIYCVSSPSINNWWKTCRIIKWVFFRTEPIQFRYFPARFRCFRNLSGILLRSDLRRCRKKCRLAQCAASESIKAGGRKLFQREKQRKRQVVSLVAGAWMQRGSLFDAGKSGRVREIARCPFRRWRASDVDFSRTVTGDATGGALRPVFSWNARKFSSVRSNWRRLKKFEGSKRADVIVPEKLMLYKSKFV